MQALNSANTINCQSSTFLKGFKTLHISFFVWPYGWLSQQTEGSASAGLLLLYGGTISGTRILLILFIENIINVEKENAFKFSALTKDTIPFEQL